MPMITSGSPKERQNDEQDAGHNLSNCSIWKIARELAAMGYTNKQRAPYSASCVKSMVEGI